MNPDEKVPAGQGVHDVAPIPEKVPGPQGLHRVADPRGAIVPARQVEHSACPGVDEAVPGVQEVHACCPVNGCAEPGRQTGQTGGKGPLPAASAVPLGQGVQPPG